MATRSIDESMAIVAGAGSGKTTVLIERCANIIGGDWSRLDQILVITFTEKAAGELKARIRERVPSSFRYKLENAWIGTFHSFSARILRQHSPLIGIDPAFSIIDENASNLAISECVKSKLISLLSEGDESADNLVDSIDFRSATAVLEELMRFRWHAKRSFLSKSEATGEEQVLIDALASVYNQIEAKYESYLRAISALDFQDIEMRIIELLQGNNDILEYYQKKFRHILVDEFQDTNDTQTELVLKLFNPRKNKLCIVGDPRQSIYRFRGANINCFGEVMEIIRKNSGTPHVLAHNFRSRKSIVDFVNRAGGSLNLSLFAELPNELIAVRENESINPIKTISIELPSDSKVFDRRTAEAKLLASFINEQRSENRFRLGDIVCLFRALTGTSPYELEFRKAKIPYRFFGGRGLLDRQEISDLMAVLNFAANPNDQIAMLGILRSPLIGLSDNELVLLTGPDGNSFLENIFHHPRAALLNDLKSWPAHLNPSEILRRAVDVTGYEALCHKLDESGGMAANIEHFISLATSIERQGPTPLINYAGFIRELKKQSAKIGDPVAQSDNANAVKCMTVHAAKGLEFPVVILPDLFRTPPAAGGNWIFLRDKGVAFKMRDPDAPFGPRKETERYITLRDRERDESNAESKRLLYVAMTRARDMLVIPIHKEMKKEGPWHKWLAPLIENENGI